MREGTLGLAAVPSRRATRLIRTETVGLALLGIAAILTVPTAGYALTPGGEYEYQAALTAAFAQHLQWGRDVLWTYGPLGFMDVPAYLYFRPWILGLALNLAAHSALFAVIALLLLRLRARPFLWILTAAILVAFFERYQGFDFERFPVLDHKEAITAALLLYLSVDSASRRQAVVLAAIAGLVVGLLLLGKGTALITAGGLVAVFAVVATLRREFASLGMMVAGLATGLVGGWVAVGQSLANLATYLRSSYEFIAGYTAAESWFNEAPADNPNLQIAIGAAILAAAAATFLAALWKRNRSVATLQLLFVVLLFTAYKNSFVRFDEPHGLTFWSLAAVLEGLVGVLGLSQLERLRPTLPVSVASCSVAACFVLVVLGVGPMIGNTPQIQPAFLFPDNLATYRHAAGLVLKPAHRGEETDQVTAVLRSYYPLPNEAISLLRQGTVDVVPWDPQLALAYGFEWKQQPVLLSYVAASRPYLDQKNAEFYSGPDAPRFVLLSANQLDDRYPLFDEPQAYRSMMQNYQVEQQLSDWLVLEKRSQPLPASETPLGTANARLGDWISVPADENRAVFGRIQIGYSALGSALLLVDRPPELHIRFRYGDGRVASPYYRFIPATGPDGLFLSSFAPDQSTYGDVIQGNYTLPIQAIQITADSPLLAYQDNVRVDYFGTAR